MDDFGYEKSFSPASEIYLFVLVGFDRKTISACMPLAWEISEIVKISPELKEFWEGLMVPTLFQMLSPYGGVNRNSKLIIIQISYHFPWQ
jgi:hypothetical protein